MKSNNVINLFHKKISTKEKQRFGILCVLYLVAISAILRANFNYIDDLGRVYRGYKKWENFSRYLSNFLSNFIHADPYLSDVSPLPQCIAVVLLVIASMVFLYTVFGKDTFSIWTVAALFPLGLSPYFLECIVFKYDSPYMACAVLFSILPLIWKEKSVISYGIAIVLGIVGTCTTYQAALGFFPTIVVLVAFKEWNEGKPIKFVLKDIVVAAGAYLVALLLFMKVIMQPVTENYINPTMPSAEELIPVVIDNYRIYFNNILTDHKTEWLVLIAVLLCCFCGTTIVNTKRHKIVALGSAVVSLMMMALLCFGVYPFMTEPSFVPRAMIGFGIFLTALGGYCVQSRKTLFLSKIACFALSWCFFVFAFTYGNALYQQKEYTDFRIQQVITDLNDITSFDTETKTHIQIENSIAQSPIIAKHPKDYKMLKKLIPNTFGNTFWASYELMYYYGIDNIVRDTTLDLRTMNLPIVVDTVHHRIRADKEHILIELK